MKINELSKLTGVKGETIRMYRQRGLLVPEKLPNGYYDYTLNDLVQLLYIRKLRGSGLGLDAIAYTYTNNNSQEIFETLNREKQELEEQIRQLNFRRALLELTLGEYQRCNDNNKIVSEYQIDLPGYSICFDHLRDDPQVVNCLHNVELFVQNIIMDLDGLNAETLPEYIPFSLGLATYAYILENSHIPVPESARPLPPGTYLTLWLEPEIGRQEIHCDQLRPLLQYAETHGYRFTKDCGGFIYRVNCKDGGCTFRYRFRVRVEKIPGSAD